MLQKFLIMKISAKKSMVTVGQDSQILFTVLSELQILSKSQVSNQSQFLKVFQNCMISYFGKNNIAITCKRLI